jgi:IS605 OrfB family transposase
MQVIKTHSYRIKDSSCKKYLCRTAGTVNYVWNYLNATSYKAIRERREWLSEFDLNNLTSGASKVLPLLHSQTIQAISKEYVKARTQHKKAKLRFRSAKNRTLGWIPFKASGVKFEDDTIKYRGKEYRLWLSRPVPEGCKLVTGSFNQDSEGRWYVNLQFKMERSESQPQGDRRIGVDLGLKTQATCSDGVKLERPNLTKKYEKELATAQRARKKKRVRKVHAKVKNTRKDWNHKKTTELIANSALIRVGNVNSSALKKTRMAKSVSDAGWYQFKEMLSYKAITHSVDFEETNESYTTVTCSHCFARTGPTGLSGLGVREWVCSGCGATHDRDVNAAKNILIFSLVGRPDAGCLAANRSNLSSCENKRRQRSLFPLGH